jgi:hypothetical protein
MTASFGAVAKKEIGWLPSERRPPESHIELVDKHRRHSQSIGSLAACLESIRVSLASIIGWRRACFHNGMGSISLCIVASGALVWRCAGFARGWVAQRGKPSDHSYGRCCANSIDVPSGAKICGFLRHDLKCGAPIWRQRFSAARETIPTGPSARGLKAATLILLALGCARGFRPGAGAFHSAGELWAAGVGDGEWAAAEHGAGTGADEGWIYLAGD